MKTWNVRLEYRYIAEVEVDAETQEEAIKAAEDAEVQEQYDAYVSATARRMTWP